MIVQYFDLEYSGINKVIEEKENIVRAVEILEKTSKYVNGVWEIGLLWKTEDKYFPDSRKNALHRLYLLERKLDSNEDFAHLYYKEMDRLFELKFAVKALGPPTKPRKWYLPHFGVQNINKPGRVRLVFDASA